MRSAAALLQPVDLDAMVSNDHLQRLYPSYEEFPQLRKFLLRWARVSTTVTDGRHRLFVEEPHLVLRMDALSSWFRTLMDASPEIFFRCALVPIRRVAYLSQSVRDLTGYDADDFQADPRLLWTIVPREERARLRRILRARRGRSVVMPLRHRTGALIPVQLRVVPVIRSRRVIAIEAGVGITFHGGTDAAHWIESA